MCRSFVALRILFLTVFILLLSGFKKPSETTVVSNPTFRWTILSNSTMAIKGRSNVNTFNCTANNIIKSVPIEGIAGKGQSIGLRGSVTMDINQFDCKNRMLDRDMRKTLNAEKYPTMTIHFIDLERNPSLQKGNADILSGTVQIILAGKRRQFTLRYDLTKTAQGLCLAGGRTFTFSDFDLQPPSKAGGMIKVKDHFDVNFSLNLSDR